MAFKSCLSLITDDDHNDDAPNLDVDDVGDVEKQPQLNIRGGCRFAKNT